MRLQMYIQNVIPMLFKQRQSSNSLLRRFSVIKYPLSTLSTTTNDNDSNTTNGNNNNNRNPLMKELIQQIKFFGPMTVNEYMRLSLTHTKYGFYMKQDVFGQKGHFITSPEVSQIFGELIAIWIMYNWQLNSRPGMALDIIELGPGRGTLACDIARAMSQFGQKTSLTCRFRLVEISPFLRSLQFKNLCGNNLCIEDEHGVMHSKTIYDQPISWYESYELIPENFHFGASPTTTNDSPPKTESNTKTPTTFPIFIANEFFDAFPIHKFVRNAFTKQWKELLIDYDDQTKELRWIQSKNETPLTKFLSLKKYFDIYPDIIEHLEFSPQTLIITENIIDRINKYNCGFGCLLICDYGYDDKEELKCLLMNENLPSNIINRDTLRAYQHHKQCDPLKNPGQADLTADVDFGAIHRNLSLKARCFGTVTQRHFLQEMGIQFRLIKLLQSTMDNVDAQQELINSARKLMEEMGNRFKFMSIFGNNSQLKDKPVGF